VASEVERERGVGTSEGEDGDAGGVGRELDVGSEEDGKATGVGGKAGARKRKGKGKQ
jgi:hypothetical protein